MQKWYSGAAPAVTLTAQLPSTQTTGTFDVSAGTGYPTDGPFVVQLNRGYPNEEKLLVTRSSAVFTVVERGYDGSVPQTHEPNSVLEHVLDADIIQEASAHINNTALHTAFDHLAPHHISPKPATDAPGTYPIGISVTYMNDASWPLFGSTNAVITTSNQGYARISQQIVATTGAATMGYMRSGTGSTWLPWVPLTQEVEIGRIDIADSLSNTVAFTFIPQYFKHLKLEGYVNYTAAAGVANPLTARLNYVAAGYYSSSIYTTTTATVTSGNNIAFMTLAQLWQQTAANHHRATFEGIFHEYTSTKPKTWRSHGGGINGTSYQVLSETSATATGVTDPISTIEIIGTAGNFEPETYFILKGVL